MGIRCTCPNGHPLHLKAFLAGKRGICPQCNTSFRIPFPESTEEILTPVELRALARSEVTTASAVPARANKSPTNGHAINGHSINGHSAIGPSINGHAGMGHSADSLYATVKFEEFQSEPSPSDSSTAILERPRQTVPNTSPDPSQESIPLNSFETQPEETIEFPSAKSVSESVKPEQLAVKQATKSIDILPVARSKNADSSKIAPLKITPTPPNKVKPTDPILEAPDAVWYVRPPGGGQYGPATGDILRKWMTEGRVSSDSHLWRNGWEDWRQAGQLFPDLPVSDAATLSRSTNKSAIERGDDTLWLAGGQKHKAKSRRNSSLAIGFVVLLSVLSISLLIGLAYVIRDM